MDSEKLPYARQSDSGPRFDGAVLLTLISAGLFLYVGFMLGLAPATGAPFVYKWSVIGFVWMARIVGVGLLVMAALTTARVPAVAVLDLFVSALAAVGCIVVGVIWLAYSDMDGFIVLLFGLLNGSGAQRALIAWRHERAMRQPQD